MNTDRNSVVTRRSVLAVAALSAVGVGAARSGASDAGGSVDRRHGHVSYHAGMATPFEEPVLREPPEPRWESADAREGNSQLRGLVPTDDGVGTFVSMGVGAPVRYERIDADGSLREGRTLHFTSGTSIDTVLETDDGGYVLAGTYFGGDLLAAKLDAELHVVWERRVEPEVSMLVRDAAVPSTGGVVLCGRRDVDGEDDAKMGAVRFDANGEVRWRRSYGDGWSNAYGVAPNDDGGVVIAGQFEQQPTLVSVDDTGEQVWRWTAEDSDLSAPRAVVQTDDGGCAALARLPGRHRNVTESALLRIDADGRKQWSAVHEIGGSFRPLAIAETERGFLLTGQIERLDDPTQGNGLVLETDEDGVLLWKSVAERDGDSEFRAATATGDRFVVGGSTAECDGQNTCSWHIGYEIPTIPLVPVFDVEQPSQRGRAEPRTREEVTFDASRTYVAPSAETDYEWTVDGDPIGDGPETIHRFDAAGSYEVELEVRADEEVATVTKTVEVRPIAVDASEYDWVESGDDAGGDDAIDHAADDAMALRGPAVVATAALAAGLAARLRGQGKNE